MNFDGSNCSNSVDDLNHIIFKAQDGDKQAQEFIISQYAPLVKRRAKAFFLAGGSHEDIEQEGMIGLYNAIKDFVMEKKIPFEAFASICITRQIITAVKKSRRKKHFPLNTYISINNTIKDVGKDAEQTFLDVFDVLVCDNPETLFINKEDMEKAQKIINDTLSSFEIEILKEYLKGKSYQEIAEASNKNQKAVDNAMQRIKKKLKNFF